MSGVTRNPQSAGVRGQRYAGFSTLLVWLMIGVMILPSGLDYRNLGLDDTANPVTRGIMIFILLGSLWCVVARTGQTVRLLKGSNPFFVAFILLAVASTVWSIDPALTGRRLLRMLIQSSTFLVLAVAAWERQRFQNVLRPALTVLLLGSLIFGWISPELAIHQENSPELKNAWHGLATQKNILGAIASFGCIFWLHAAIAKSASRLAVLVGICSSLACLLLSRSSTSLMATVFSCSTMFLMMWTPGSMRRSMPYLVTSLSVVALLYALAMLKVVPGLDILLSPIPLITGKDLTFSGRSEIWAAVVNHIRWRPLLGSGYGAFWSGPIPGTESYPIKATLFGFYPGSAHNGYLDVINDIGAFGFVCLVAYLLRYVADALRLYKIDRSQGALFIAVFMQQTMGNLSESGWFNVTNIEFIVMSMATLSLARSLLETRSLVPRGR